jgi:hypothetical protein
VARKTEPSNSITGEISVEVGGQTYTGTYTVKDRWIDVRTNYGSKGAAVHEAPPGHLEIDCIAKLLMHEIIAAARNFEARKRHPSLNVGST